jgi:hypothetical protein
MRYMLVFLTMLICPCALGQNSLVLPAVDFSATAVHEAGALQTRETLYYTPGKLRIERGEGFSTTILDLKTQTQCLLMVNRTYLVLPMDDELYRRYIAQTTAMSGARKLRTERIEGLETTKYAFGDEGALEAAGSYWLTNTGVMIKREYEDGVFGRNVHHLEYLIHISFAKQPSGLFLIPAGYTRAK